MKNYSETLLSDISNTSLFDKISKKIELEFDAKISSDLRGLDSTYIDFLVGNCKITLHQEHFIGIIIHPTELDNASKEENVLAKKWEKK